MYKEDLALNNQQWLICHKTKPSQNSGLSLYSPKKRETTAYVATYNKSNTELFSEIIKNLEELKTMTKSKKYETQQKSLKSETNQNS